VTRNSRNDLKEVLRFLVLLAVICVLLVVMGIALGYIFNRTARATTEDNTYVAP
jgi:uncharacterized membrane protein AbrB (regulator of aidB expression)